MGRAPCCDKTNVKRGPWSPEEDAKLKAYMEQHGTGGNWIALPQKIGLKRCGKSCRLRWLNYLRPNLRHGSFSEEEDNIICSLYVNIGSRWSIIAAQLPGRTDNDIKNYWNTKLKKKLLVKQRNNYKEQHEAQLARHVFSLTTQDHIKSTESDQNLVLPVISQNPYNWPTTESEHNSFPISSVLEANAGSNVQHYNYLNNNQTSSSLRNLATKLEGVKLSDDDHQQPYTNMNYSQHSTCDIYFPQDQTYSSSTMNMITPAGLVSTSTCGFGNYFPNDHLDLSELNSCVNQQQQIDGSMIMRVASGSTNSITSTESSTSTWGDISSLVYDYQYQGHCQQRIPDQDVVTFQESSRYFGMQTQ